MTPDQFIQSQRNKIKELVAYFPKAVADVHADQMKRIYEDGDLYGKKRYNSTKELWIDTTKDAPVTRPPRSKPGSNRTAKKTTYYKSYKAFRADQGRESSFVNLRLTGTLQRDHAASLTQLGPLKWVTGVKNKANADKVEGLEEKYGKFYKPTRKERDLLNKKLLDHRLKIGL